jgi:beta-lactam-binding protein with PASTA domain
LEYYGGKVAAPVFKKIAERVIGYYGITNNSNQNLLESKVVNVSTKPEIQENQDEIFLIPTLIDLRVEDAIQILKEKSIKFEIQNLPQNESDLKSYIVESQEPAGNIYLKRTDKIIMKLMLKKITTDRNNLIQVPNVTSLSIRKAINKIISAGFNVEVVGGGTVVMQIPRGGSLLNAGSKVVLMCKENL